MIKIVTVENKKLEKEFVLFPFDLYKDCEYWVAPIINEELEAMDRSKNPVFKNAEAEFYLAYKDGNVVGRIAAIVNWVEIEEFGLCGDILIWFSIFLIDWYKLLVALVH